MPIAGTKIVSVERNITGIKINRVPLKGKIDKLEFNGTAVTVVDYKSGSYEKAMKKMNPPGKDDSHGGDYWRQAVFYKILVDNYTQKEWKVAGVEFDFVEPDNSNKYHKHTITVGPADEETVKQQFTGAWTKIQSGKSFTGCGRQNCYWCNFVRDNRAGCE